MTFSGGGSNLTLSHTHDGNIINDGGSLNMKNITQGALSSGSITYSDGNHLQELLVGTPTHVLTVSAVLNLQLKKKSWFIVFLQ